jgi:hypothetical protein
MIISQILLPSVVGGESDFSVEFVNLEDVALVFRLGYTLWTPLTRPPGQGMTGPLNGMVRLKGRLATRSAWTHTGGAYQLGNDVIARPGEARHEGLHVISPVPKLIGSDKVSGQDTLRGYFELSLPMLPSKSGRQVVQLDHPARVLITVSRNIATGDGPPTCVVLPLASGRSEHLIAPDAPVLAPAPNLRPGMGVLKRAAPKRRRSR